MDPTTRSKDQANEVLNANAHFANHLYSFITPMSLKCAAQLGIADAIQSHGQPMTLLDLSAALPIHPHKAKFLPQLMRILTHSGYFSYAKILGANQDVVDAYGYSLTTASQFLLEDHPFSMKPYLLFILDPLLVKPWVGLSDWFRNDDNTAYETANGMAIWEGATHQPELNKVLNDTMAGDSKMVASVLLSSQAGKQIFDGVSSLVDVGGGVGEMAKAISTAFPHIKCVVLDLPHVVEGLQGTRMAHNNLSFVAGDMFDSIPPANALLLKWILHDWCDEYALKILKQCKRAITSNKNCEGHGKVIIIDVVMDESDNKGDYKKQETQMFYDMEMMTLVAGKERTKIEWEKLLLEAGFKGGFNVFPLLGFRSVIEVFP